MYVETGVRSLKNTSTRRRPAQNVDVRMKLDATALRWLRGLVSRPGRLRGGSCFLPSHRSCRYSTNPSFLNLFMKKLTRGRVVPTISARISWDTLGSARRGPSGLAVLCEKQECPGQALLGGIEKLVDQVLLHANVSSGGCEDMKESAKLSSACSFRVISCRLIRMTEHSDVRILTAGSATDMRTVRVAGRGVVRHAAGCRRSRVRMTALDAAFEDLRRRQYLVNDWLDEL